MKKGQKQPDSVKDAFRETKMKNHLSSLSGTNVDEQSNRNFVIPSHRKNKRFSSIEEYKTFIHNNKWSVRKFVENGYSKVQIGFFNFILKGKLKLGRDDFIRLYCQEFVELKVIAKMYSVPNEYMTFVREYYGIKRIGSKGLRRGRDEGDLTTRQKSILVGSVLGDGYIDDSGYFKVKHGSPQKSYADEMFCELEDQSAQSEPSSSSYYDDRFDSVYESHEVRTRNHSEVKVLRDIFYKDGTKVVDNDVLSLVDELALAVWFMDDGSTAYTFSKSGDVCGCECRIFTCSFSEDENETIKKWFSERWSISSNIRYKFPDEKKNPFLSFCGVSAFSLLEIIRPHVFESMKYKVDPSAWLERRRAIADKADFISSCPTKSSFRGLSDVDQEGIIKSIFNHYRKCGFPYVFLDGESQKLSFDRIANWHGSNLFDDSGNIKVNTNSTGIIWSNQPHMFNMATRGSMTPMDIFLSDDKFKDAIKRRLSYGGKCTPSGIRSALKEYRGNRSVGNFLPSVARGVLTKLSADENTRVLDFCAGFGGRLLGCMAHGVGEYVGIDPLTLNCRGLSAMSSLSSNTTVRIINDVAEDALLSLEEGFDMVFTSPPYFDKEIYSPDITQSYNKFTNYSKWLNEWLIYVSALSSRLLSSDGKFVLSIGKSDDHNVAHDFIEAVPFLNVVETIQVCTPVISYRRGKTPMKFEYIYVMDVDQVKLLHYFKEIDFRA
jgi:16S rRNA G966 N2-methylase RsmD